MSTSREAAITDDTLERLNDLLETVDGLLKAALSKGNVADATKVIREAHALLATRGRILGAFPKDATTIDNRRQYVFTGMSDDMVRALCDPVKGAKLLEYASSGLHDGNTCEPVGTQTLVESGENAKR